MDPGDEIKSLKADAEAMDQLCERLARLEAELAAVKTANTALVAKVKELEAKQGRKILPAPPVEQQTRVTYPAQPANFTMPSDEELNRLRDIVGAVYPALTDFSGPGFYGSKDERSAIGTRNSKPRFAHSARCGAHRNQIGSTTSRIISRRARPIFAPSACRPRSVSVRSWRR